MEPMNFKPDKAQKIMWYIFWSIAFVIGIALWITITMLKPSDKVIINYFSSAWLLIMILIFIYLPALYKSLKYSIENDSIKMNMGVFWKNHVTVPYKKITNLDVTQGPVERIFHIGTIHIQTAGAGGTQGAQAELKLIGIKDTNSLKNNIMDRVNVSNFTKPDLSHPQSIQDSDPDVFRLILSELKAIRKVLARQPN